MGRILALDYGKKRIGLALSDLLQIMGNPFDVIEHISFKKDALKIVEIAKSNEVSTIVVGVPINMNGTEGEMAEFVKTFIEELKAVTDIPVEVIDERLTTMQAERMLVEEADISREKRKGLKDKIAASLILQTYLSIKAI